MIYLGFVNFAFCSSCDFPHSWYITGDLKKKKKKNHILDILATRVWVILNLFFYDNSNDSLVLRALVILFSSAWFIWCWEGSQRSVVVLPEGIEISPGQVTSCLHVEERNLWVTEQKLSRLGSQLCRILLPGATRPPGF